MSKTRKQRTAGFTLVEVIVAIAIMGLVSAPICVSLVLAGRLNARSRAVMEAELEVRTAVETLMAEGITEEVVSNLATDFPNVTVKTTQVRTEGDEVLPYYHVTVSDKQTEPLVTVETYIRAVEAPEGSAGGGTGGGGSG